VSRDSVDRAKGGDAFCIPWPSTNVANREGARGNKLQTQCHEANWRSRTIGRGGEVAWRLLTRAHGRVTGVIQSPSYPGATFEPKPVLSELVDTRNKNPRLLPPWPLC